MWREAAAAPLWREERGHRELDRLPRDIVARLQPRSAWGDSTEAGATAAAASIAVAAALAAAAAAGCSDSSSNSRRQLAGPQG